MEAKIAFFHFQHLGSHPLSSNGKVRIASAIQIAHLGKPQIASAHTPARPRLSESFRAFLNLSEQKPDFSKSQNLDFSTPALDILVLECRSAPSHIRVPDNSNSSKNQIRVHAHLFNLDCRDLSTSCVALQCFGGIVTTFYKCMKHKNQRYVDSK